MISVYSRPFPHIIIEEYLTLEAVREINATWPTRMHKEQGKAQTKWSTSELTEPARRVFEQINVPLIQSLVGIEGLFVDPENAGGGHHEIPRGGFLDMHVDFNLHENGWLRRVNLLIYLNEGWRDDWRGHLQLGVGPEKKRILPTSGRAVIFETNEQSVHGHPERLQCPQDRTRRSLAFYLYSDAQGYNAQRRSTIYL